MKERKRVQGSNGETSYPTEPLKLLLFPTVQPQSAVNVFSNHQMYTRTGTDGVLQYSV